MEWISSFTVHDIRVKPIKHKYEQDPLRIWHTIPFVVRIFRYTKKVVFVRVP